MIAVSVIVFTGTKSPGQKATSSLEGQHQYSNKVVLNEGGEGSGEMEDILDVALQNLSYRPDTALKYARIGLEESLREGDQKAEAKAHLILGKVFSNYSAYSSAVEHFFLAKDKFILLEDQQGLADVHNALGDTYYYTRQLNEALDEHVKALEISREARLATLEAETLGYLGHFHEKQLDYDKALNYQQLALQKYEELEDPHGLSTIYGNLGSIYEDQEAYEKAFEYFSLALQFNLSTNNEEERIIHLNNLGDIYRKQGDFEKGLDYTSQALKLARELGNAYQEKSAMRDMAKIYGAEGNFKLAYKYLDEAYELNASLYDKEGANQIARMQSLYEMSQTQRELDVLKEKQRVSRIVRGSLIAGLAMLMALFSLIVNRQRLKSQKDKELLKAQQQLTRQELENSQLREKQLQDELEAKASELSSHALSIVQKNKILKDVKTQLTHIQQQQKKLKTPISQLIQKIDRSFHFDKDWKKFNQIFEQVHPEFYRKLRELYPSLSSSEIRLCALLRLNLEPKDIASILGISLDSLRVSRYRLRKKMQLDRQTNLVAYIMGL